MACVRLILDGGGRPFPFDLASGARLDRARRDPADMTGGQRHHPLLPMSLVLCTAALAMNRGLAQVFATMAPRLARLLGACGIRFTQIGEVVDHHGRRGSFRITHEDLRAGAARGPVPSARVDHA